MHLRSEEGQLREAARRLLAQHRSDRRDRQFCDHGTQYRTAIFYHDEEQRRLAEASKAALEKSKPLQGSRSSRRSCRPATFYPAEDYHQDYYKKNPVRYKFYRDGCGRDARLKELWGSAPH